MGDWSKPFRASYRFMRVSRATGFETAQLDGISGGTLQINQDTETYETALLRTSPAISIGADLVRGYLDAAWEDGTEESVCLGTWLANVPSRDIDGKSDECVASLDGRLQELSDDSFESPLSIAAGANIVAYARGIAEGAGLTADATPSSAVLGSAWAFGLNANGDEDGGSKLQAVNSLLSLAGYASATTDRMGSIVMRPYVAPEGRSPVWSFKEGRDATFLAEAVEERDLSKVANVVVVVYESDGQTTVGTASDDDPMSEVSTVSMGRRKVAKYTYFGTATQAEADAKAAELLRTEQAIIHRVKLRHAHCPASVGDVVDVDWPSAGIRGTFAIRTQTVDIGSAGCMTTSELRRFERRG